VKDETKEKSSMSKGRGGSGVGTVLKRDWSAVGGNE
jgi:hypothetical protein